MAQANDGANLDLAQILQTLANLTGQPNEAQQGQQQPYDPNQILSTQPNLVSEHGSVSLAAAPYHHDPPHHSTLHAVESLQHLQPPPTIQNRTATPNIDPSTIIEWKLGLRCVNKVASQNPHFEASVQKLIKDQERNVKDWAAGRERLNEEQIAKRENEQKFRAAVSLPGVLEGTAPLRTPEREAQEHNQYTQKVYNASRKMAESHSTALKGLGVPFFGVKPGLILADDAESNEGTDSNPSDSSNGKVTKKQVLELQRKMLNHLVEMYGD